ncbi:hypothetical protein IFM61606_04771 [Aspergillus udagawae]|uniref:Uncharacterized protein n=1 Tax=Aspergillus udagawae TaxID=91492 RepID=A0ABQ1B043_9EURO|nr:hypothetical protein IFM51744_02189 [Aspergillus udagawae]GFF91251.1 hypothetical protein IFM53868_06443 [Aspergillus udagawae]GFG03227.1 hypothetical protein IFM5058_01328 [Aspergillus udagawae]GFG24850.1 hypothetical protein IFM61606_04771 [Aspergillus udagawae]
MSSQPLRGDARTRPSRIPTFQAPTKASLARSHPEILERSHNKSPGKDQNQGDQQRQAETGVFGLRDRKAFRPSLASTASPIRAARQAGDARSPFSTRRSSGIQAFAAPPRRVSRKITPADFVFGSPANLPNNARNAEPINTPEDQLASELGSATGEVNVSIDSEQPSLHEEFEEPDLPPTPTQLGLENPPERPRGLLSSSPSTQPGRFRTRRTGDLLEKSPSKLRRVDYGSQTSDLSGLGVIVSKESLPEPVVKKQKLKRELSADLSKLKEDIAELESWSERLGQEHETIEPDHDLDKLISILVAEDLASKNAKRPAADPSISSLLSTLLPFSTKFAPSIQQSPTPTNPFALEVSARAKPYLTVFAPLNLTAHSNTTSDQKNDTLLERHHLTLSAPAPFPSNIYNIPVIYETNTELQCLTSISVPTSLGTSATKIPTSLRRWIDSRLFNPLLKIDISGLCQGINQYWEAMLSRALIWSEIEERHSNLTGRPALGVGAPGKNSTQQGQDDKSSPRRLLPHLKRSTMLFESKETRMKLLLSCDLSMDEWSSEPKLTPDISIASRSTSSGTSCRKIEQETKKLFQEVLRDSRRQQGAIETEADVIIRAVECVLKALFGAEAGGKP